MVVSNHFNPLAAGIAGVVLVSALTIPAIRELISQTQQPKPKTRTYQDKDGVSTEALTSACSASIPKTLLLSLSILGLITSVVLAVLEGIETHSAYTSTEDWLNFGQWVSNTCLENRACFH